MTAERTEIANPLRPLRWLTILSLDAPLVTVSWQALFARTHGTSLRWEHRGILFLSVWLGYSADRWLDARRGAELRTERHRWYHRHRRPLLALFVLVLAVALTLSIESLSARDLQNGFLLTAAALLYILFAQTGHRLRRYGEFKCSFVGALNAASASLFAAHLLDAATLGPTAVIALLFTANCFAIRRWEGLLSLSTRTVTAAALGVTLAAILLGAAAPAQVPVAAATLVALALLLLLDRARHRFDTSTLRALADLSLLTPLLFLLRP